MHNNHTTVDKMFEWTPQSLQKEVFYKRALKTAATEDNTSEAGGVCTAHSENKTSETRRICTHSFMWPYKFNGLR